MYIHKNGYLYVFLFNLEKNHILCTTLEQSSRRNPGAGAYFSSHITPRDDCGPDNTITPEYVSLFGGIKSTP